MLELNVQSMQIHSFSLCVCLSLCLCLSLLLLPPLPALFLLLSLTSVCIFFKFMNKILYRTLLRLRRAVIPPPVSIPPVVFGSVLAKPHRGRKWPLFSPHLAGNILTASACEHHQEAGTASPLHPIPALLLAPSSPFCIFLLPPTFISTPFKKP